MTFQSRTQLQINQNLGSKKGLEKCFRSSLGLFLFGIVLLFQTLLLD
jgi:hypothetical protein